MAAHATERVVRGSAGCSDPRANTIVVPGGKMDLAMQLIFTPFIWRMMERRRHAMGGL